MRVSTVSTATLQNDGHVRLSVTQDTNKSMAYLPHLNQISLCKPQDSIIGITYGK